MTKEQEDIIWNYICWLHRIGLEETGDMIFESYFDDDWNLKLIFGKV